MSVQFSCSVVSDSVTPWLQHARLPCPSPTPRAYSNPCPSSQWCHPTISSSVIPFSSCLQSFPASRSFQTSQFFTSGGQNIGSFTFSTSPSKECSGLISFRMDWLDLLAVQGILKSLLQHHSSKASILRLVKPNIFLLMKVKVAQPCWTLCNPMECVGVNPPGQNTGVGSHSLLQGILPTEGWNPGLLHCRRILYQLRHQGSPKLHWQQRMVLLQPSSVTGPAHFSHTMLLLLFLVILIFFLSS